MRITTEMYLAPECNLHSLPRRDVHRALLQRVVYIVHMRRSLQHFLSHDSNYLKATQLQSFGQNLRKTK